MKKLCFISCLLMASFILLGQTGPVKNGFRSDLSKIISSYTDQFSLLIGEILVENPQSTDYSSQIRLSGAEECTVTKYSSMGKPVYSFEALMLRTDDLNEAIKKYKSLYNSINNLSVFVGQTTLVFKGVYTKPSDEKKFSSIVFQPSNKGNTTGKIKVELLLEAEMMKWTIRILIYETEREDYERGKVIE